MTAKSAVSSTKTITTRLGTITGTDHGGVSEFLGIPYAAPPVGRLRWMPPTAASWNGTLEATTHANRSLQPPYPPALNFGPIPGDESEDCLYLNIYTPAADGKLRPVMFWIHGGAYIQGSANEYDGSIVAADNDVVVVAINYRLGIFGFLDLSRFGPEFAGSASLGFQDQIAALAWVRDNIQDYGGDPGNVTIWGESAGAGSVLALHGAPTAHGLFHKAVAFSPGSMSTTAMDPVPGLATNLDVEPDALLGHLQAMSAQELFALQISGSAPVTPFVDGTVITQLPTDAIRDRGTSGVPLIVGCTKDEGTYLAEAVNTAPGALEMMVPVFSAMIAGGDPEAYLAYLDQLLPDATPLQRMERVWFDLFRSCTLRSAVAATEAGPGGWVYNFDVPTDNPLGATHGSDIAFTFNAYKTGGGAIAFHDGNDPAIRELSNHWSSTFAAFARTGNPNGAGLPSWPQYDVQTRACLVVGLPSSVVNDPDGPELRDAYGLLQEKR